LSLCSAFERPVLFLDQQSCDYHEVVGEYCCAHQEFEVLATLRKTALHAASPEKNRDAALDAGTESLGFFEGWALFKCFLVRCLSPASLGNAYEIDTMILAPPDTIRAEKPPIPDGHPKSPTCGHLKIPH
jgi:hypothetical protein